MRGTGARVDNYPERTPSAACASGNGSVVTGGGHGGELGRMEWEKEGTRSDGAGTVVRLRQKESGRASRGASGGNLRDYGNQRAMREIGFDHGRPSGNWELLHGLR